MKIESVDYCGKVDCWLINDEWNGGCIFESDSETIFTHPDWTCSIVISK